MRVLQTLIAFSGNAPPQLAITRELVKRGHEVTVLAHSAAGERIIATGAQFRAFQHAAPQMDLSKPGTDLIRDWEARTRFGAGVRVLRNCLFGLTENVSRECASLIAERPVDALIYDWMLSGAGIAAQAADLPSIAILHCPYPLPLPDRPAMFMGMRPIDGPIGALRDRIAAAISTRVLASGLPSLNRIRAEHGLTPLDRWSEQILTADEIHSLTAAELEYSSRSAALPSNVHFVGPAFEACADSWCSQWPAENEDPLVLISFSTSYMNQRASVQRVLDAIAGLPVRALLTCGPALDPDALCLPSNARAVGFIPHRSVLPHASLMITHAGWQTVNASLAAGVPLICIPAGRDQPDNAARVVHAGAGVRVRKGISARRLRRVIERALADDRLRDGARAMARALGRQDGAVSVVQSLERLVARRTVASTPR